MDEFGPMDIMDMMSQIKEAQEAVKYLQAHQDDIPGAITVFTEYIVSDAGSNSVLMLKQLCSSGMLGAIIDYANSIAKVFDATNRYASYHEEVVIIHNPDDILKKLKEAKDNGDNNS